MIRTVFVDFFAGLAAVALAAGFLWPSYLVGRVLVPSARPATRLAAAAATTFWLAAAFFWLLASPGLFRLPVTLALVAVLGIVAHHRLEGRGGWSLLGEDLRAIGTELRRAGRPLQAVGALLVTLVLLAWLRGTLAPPLGWDSLTYHLVKAGRFVQAGGWVVERAPDAWSYYEYFPFVGDIYWAWALLPGRSDLWLTTAGVAIWGAVLLAVYALGRELGATPRGAAWAALALGAMPSLLVYLSSAYVDSTTLLLFVLGALFAVRRLTGVGRLREALLVAAPLGLMVGTKITTAPLLALGAVVIGWTLLRSRAPRRSRVLVLLGCLAVSSAGAPPYLRSWLEKGSPFYPFPLEVAGRTISTGVAALEASTQTLLRGKNVTGHTAVEFWQTFLYRPGMAGSFANPGLGAVLLVLVGSIGAAVVLRRPPMRAAALFVGLCALATVAGFLSSSMEVFRVTAWAQTSGRFVTVAFAVAAAWAAQAASGVRGKRFAGLLALAVFAGMWGALPTGLRTVELPGLLMLAGIVLSAAIAVWAVLRWRRRGASTLASVTALALVVALAVVGAERLRARWRYPLWQAAGDVSAPLYHMHPLQPMYTAAWPIWQALDEGPPHRLAVTAGWDNVGHNWYRFPLLGSRLQNLVLYVPISRDGSVVDSFQPGAVERVADFKSWVGRLAAARIDTVVSLAPRWTIEDYWMSQAPQLFEPLLVTEGKLHAAFRFHREALEGAPPAAPDAHKP